MEQKLIESKIFGIQNSIEITKLTKESDEIVSIRLEDLYKRYELVSSLDKSKTKIEKIWVWLVVGFCLEVIIAGVFIAFKKEIGFYLMFRGLIGGLIMNIIMMVLACSKYNTK